MEDRDFQRELFFVGGREGERKSINMAFYQADEDGIRAARDLWRAEPTQDIKILGRQQLGTIWLRLEDFKDNESEMFLQALELSRHNDVIVLARKAPTPVLVPVEELKKRQRLSWPWLLLWASAIGVLGFVFGRATVNRKAPIVIEAGAMMTFDFPAPDVDMAAYVDPMNGKRGKPVAPKLKFTNSLGMEFVPAGGVNLCKWETRVQDYAEFAEDTGMIVRTEVRSFGSNEWFTGLVAWDDPAFEQGPQHPVIGVSWREAQAFCNWLTQKERATGVLSQDEYYRLPTKDEWTAAAGSATWSWGFEWPPRGNSANLAGSEVLGSNWPVHRNVLAGYEDAFERTAPVGSFEPNRQGFHDLSGNVWEWNLDWHPDIPHEKILRGGSWQNNHPKNFQVSGLTRTRAEARNDSIGFRVALVKLVIE